MGKYVKFDESGYKKALVKALNDGMAGVAADVHNTMQRNFGSVALRKVDAKHQAAMMNSIRYSLHASVSSIVAKFLAGGDGSKNDAFRVIYYEYGTGKSAEPPPHYSIADDPTRNPARKDGWQIYQRPYGKWVDLGQNEHFSKVKGEPRPLPNKPGTMGEEIQPHYWFRSAMKTVSLQEPILASVKSVPISAYISIRDMRKRM